jgi:ABC-2 type transport system ATP-binding protein
VAEGTPSSLKAEIGLPSVHALPADEGQRDRLAAVLARFGETLGDGSRDVAVRLREGLAGMPAVVRAVDDAGLTLASLEIQAPSLDDVFLAKTGRSLEGAAEAEPDAAVPAA